MKNNTLFSVLTYFIFITVACSQWLEAPTVKVEPETTEAIAPSPPPRPDVSALSYAAIEGVGSVVEDRKAREELPGLFVFGERHDSILGQLQVALMATRLKNAGVRYFSLEGAMADEALPGAAHQNNPERKAVALTLLEEGEINAGEYLHLVYGPTDLTVFGNESRAEYDVDGDSPEGVLMFMTALSKASAQLEGCMRYFTSGGEFKKGKEKEALECVIQTDGSSWSDYQQLTDESRRDSIADMGARFQRIVERARSAGVKIDPSTETMISEYRRWIGVADNRTITMLKNTCSRVDDAARWGGIMLNIGDAHSDRAMKAATGAEVALLPGCGPFHAVLIHSKAYASAGTGPSFDLTGEQYAKKVEGVSIDGPGTLGALVALKSKSNGGHKPEPVLGTEWFQVKDEIYLATAQIARLAAAAGGSGKPPGGGGGGPVVASDDGPSKGLPGGTGQGADDAAESGGSVQDPLGTFVLTPDFTRIEVDPSTIKRAGADVVFAVDIKEGSQVTPIRVWVKSGLVREGTQAHSSDESALRDAIARVEAKAVAQSDVSQSPSPGSRPQVVALTPDVHAVFGATLKAIESVAVRKG